MTSNSNQNRQKTQNTERRQASFLKEQGESPFTKIMKK